MTKSRRTASPEEFGGLVNVTRGTVLRWVRRGILDGAAVVREGRTVRIVVNTAKHQLAERLAAPTSGRRLYGAHTDADGQGASLSSAIKGELLANLRHRNRAAGQKFAAEAGRYVRTADVEAVLVRLPGLTLDLIEAVLPPMVDDMAKALGVPRDDLAEMFAATMNKVRAGAADLPSIGMAKH